MKGWVYFLPVTDWRYIIVRVQKSGDRSWVCSKKWACSLVLNRGGLLNTNRNMKRNVIEIGCFILSLAGNGLMIDVMCGIWGEL